MRIILNFLIVLITLTGCDDSNIKLGAYTEAPVVSRVDKYELYLAKSIDISIPKLKFSNYNEFAVFNDSLLYCVNIRKPLTIDIYDLINEKFAYEINVPDFFVKSNNVANLFIHTLDSIFFQESYPPSVVLINSEGDLVKRFDTDENIEDFISDSDVPTLYTFATMFQYRNPVFIPKTNELIMITHPIGAELRPGYDDVKRLGIYDIKNYKWKKFFAKPEGIMKTKGNLYYNFDLSIPYLLVVDTLAYITYPMDHYIYVYNINSGELLFKRAGNSKLDVNMPYPLPPSKIEDSQSAWNIRIQTPFYEPLFYNSKLSMFTRNFHFEQELKDENGRLNDGVERKGSVIIFDNELNIVGETIFENGDLGVLKSIPLSDGFLMGDNTFKLKNDDTLIYRRVYKLRLKNLE
jgi:hypothetical protein